MTEPMPASKLATALTSIGDVVLVAPPGMGKTTTLVQIADRILAGGDGIPIVVLLGNWSPEGSSLVDWILSRPSFREVHKSDFWAVADKSGVFLLLDGWNELDRGSQRRARAEIESLQRETELGFLVTTRQQSLDIPISGKRVELEPLSADQQSEVARVLRGEEGEQLVERARATSGVRNLVNIPLYLTALIDNFKGGAFPTTKEAILDMFVSEHEHPGQHADALRLVTFGLHSPYLEGLAVVATSTSSTSLSEACARKCVSSTAETLRTNGQIAHLPEPDVVLDALVSHHVLVYGCESEQYSFPHQQIQEWYASRFVEQQVFKSVTDDRIWIRLKSDVFNHRKWEEATLFVCERLAQGEVASQKACASVILAAFDVDPMLAAEIIARSTDAVWEHVRGSIQERVSRWHMPGRIDRALRFMIHSGRPEFFNFVWPLLSNEDAHILYAAFRAGERFRISILGDEPGNHIAGLSAPVRKRLLKEIAYQGSVDEFQFVAELARDDLDPQVKVAVANALAFRGAKRHVALALQGADEAALDLLARTNLIDDVADEEISLRLASVREQLRSQLRQPHDVIREILRRQKGHDSSAQLTNAIAEMELDRGDTETRRIILKARERFPKVVARGIVIRVRKGYSLPVRAEEYVAECSFAYEDETLLEIAMSTEGDEDRAKTAAAALGPEATGQLIDKLLEMKTLREDTGSDQPYAAFRLYQALRDVVLCVPISSLLGAASVRSGQADSKELEMLANLISSRLDGGYWQSSTLAADLRGTIAEFVQSWGGRLLESSNTTREQLAAIARLACQAPCEGLLPILQQLLDEELRLWKTFRSQVSADGSYERIAIQEARTSWTDHYQQAFLKNRSADTLELMREYLLDRNFGVPAAEVIAGRWRVVFEPEGEREWPKATEFSRVAKRREFREFNPSESSIEGEAIFEAIEQLITGGENEADTRHAVELAIVGAEIPIGQRGTTIEALIGMADRNSRGKLLNKLVLSGEVIDVEFVKQGIAELLAAVMDQPYWPTEERELSEWLRLLPFTNCPMDSLDIIENIPAHYLTAERMGEFLEGLGFAPDPDAEVVLFQLANKHPNLYGNHCWRNAVIRRRTRSCAFRFVKLVAHGVFEDVPAQMSIWLSGLIKENSTLRVQVYRLIGDSPRLPGIPVIARVLAECADERAVLLLTKLEQELGCSLVSRRTLERATTRNISSERWEGAFVMQPVPMSSLRRSLLATTANGGPSDVAAQHLNEIDRIRDEYGAPPSELRHPDLDSGKAWPIIGPVPNGGEIVYSPL